MSLRLNPNSQQVFLYSSPAHLPLSFAAHTWFVVNDRGTTSRWEIVFMKEQCSSSWSHLHKNFLSSLTEGLSVLPLVKKFRWKAKLLHTFNEDESARLIRVIENLPTNYPYKEKYRLWGPNSNTLTSWVLNEAGISRPLPLNAVGKNFDK